MHQLVSHYYDETYQQIQCDQPPINPPLPHHFGHLSHPIVYQSESEALYVKWAQFLINKISFMRRSGQRKRLALFKKMGPCQWPSEYYELKVRHAHANI